MHTKFIRLPLQFFAEGGEQPSGEEHQGGEGAEPAVPTFDELIKSNKAYQSELDRRISKAIETNEQNNKAKFEAQWAEREKMANMNAEEKAQHEIEKLSKENEQLKLDRDKRDRIEAAQSILIEKGLSPKLVACIDCSSEESSKRGIEVLVEVIEEEKKSAVNNMLRSIPPKAGQADGKPVINNIRDALIYEQKKNGGN